MNSRCSTLLALALLVPAHGLTGQDREVREAARRVDELVAAGLADAGQRPLPMADALTFVRRAYLTIVGRAPTLDEVDAHLRSGDGVSRGRLVDELLQSPGRASHDFNQWADVLRVESRMMRQVSGEPYAHYLKDSLAQNVPYDRMVREVLTAEGAAHQRGNGATGYWLRDLGMPLDAMSNTMRVFLGTRMECAQCHDHPFDSWTQKQFYELAAFTGGLRYSTIDPRSPEQRARVQTAQELRRELGENSRQVLRRLALTTASGISGSGTGVARLPKDYAYEDARPNQVVRAHVPFGDQPDLAEPRVAAPRRRAGGGRPRRLPDLQAADVASREAFASWVTAPANPRFTTVIVNRMWKSVFGVGLIEAVDDIRDDTEASNPELQAFLEDLMRDLRYDLVAFRRVLLNTDTFARRAGTWDPDAGEPYRFPGPLLRRLTAEQIWDSLIGLAIDDPDASLATPGARAEQVYARYEQLASLEGDDLRGFVEGEMLRYTDPQAYRRMAAERAAAARAERQSASREMRAAADRLMKELRDARRRGDQRRALELTNELRELRDRANAAANRARADLVRASELTQPAPAGHFVREWGQSDREQIASSTTDANVPQALQLLNGVVDGRLLKPGSTLMRALDAAKTPTERIETAFRAILGRRPDARELDQWRRDFARDGESLGDLVWTLVNSHEFRFVQ